MTTSEKSTHLPVDKDPQVTLTDLASEQSITHRTLNKEQATELGALMTDRLRGIAVMHATPRDSLRATEAASLTTRLFTEALIADPESFAAVSQHGGPIDRMAYTAGNIHQHQTGHNLPGAFFNYGNPDHQKAIGVLGAVLETVEDHRWDGTALNSRDADAMTANSRRIVMQEAVRGLGLIAEQRGRALVSPDTAQQVIEYLRSK